ncbi:unnamed protein product [Vicia faba]|uniref:Fatty acid amide hydrolase n=1 Tax=Vicia faba TaxID=3906 RepID=A0AAV0ZS05_VICFA|nr:unnamed protein product [Vicia faba]
MKLFNAFACHAHSMHCKFPKPTANVTVSHQFSPFDFPGHTTAVIAASSTDDSGIPSQDLAVLLEVDGVLVDAYRGNRIAFNKAFEKLGLDCASWSEPVYSDLLSLSLVRTWNFCIHAVMDLSWEPISVLDGVLVAIKDEIDCLPYPTTGGTKWLHKQRPCLNDACCVKRLRLCGAILVGKTNMHELGAGTSGINPHYGASRNPYDVNRIAGGSSSGSASLVSAGLCPFALGVDGGGSVRMPAALCGVVGLKPTFGRIPHDGVLPLNWTVGMVGILAGTVEDSLIALVIVLTVPSSEVFYSLNASIVGLAVESEGPENSPWCLGLGAVQTVCRQQEGGSRLANVNPAAEANIFGDPDAADVVFTSGADILAVGINVTHQVVLSGSDREKLASSKGKFAQYLTGILEVYFSYHCDAYNTNGVYLHDPTALLAAVDPSLVTCTEGAVRVQTSGITRGLTILYNKQKRFEEVTKWSNMPTVKVAVTVDAPRVVKLVMDRLVA